MGDRMLVEVSNTMRANVRQEFDIPFRYGGDEFLILLRGTALSEATRIGERLNESVRNLSDGEISLSTGLLEVSPPCSMKIEEIVRWTVSLMYVAKRNGGNRIFAMTDAEGDPSLATDVGADPAAKRRSA